MTDCPHLLNSNVRSAVGWQGGQQSVDRPWSLMDFVPVKIEKRVNGLVYNQNSLTIVSYRFNVNFVVQFSYLNEGLSKC